MSISPIGVGESTDFHAAFPSRKATHRWSQQ
jgi:hypothetical protein